MKTVEQMLAECSAALNRMQYTLDTDVFVMAKCDEVALLFETTKELDDFLLVATRFGVDHFNSVLQDTMTLQNYSGAFRQYLPADLRSASTVSRDCEFGVRFEFLQVPGADWRIEAMCPLWGLAPLHARMLDKRGTGSVIHVSAKYGSTDIYLEKCAELKEVIPFMAEYSNSYGRFAYYVANGIYVKPRVNLRDLADIQPEQVS